MGRFRGVTRARRLVRRLRILEAVIREPGLRPAQLAARAGISERTLRRDLALLRRHGYQVSSGDGYQLQERLRLEAGLVGLTAACEQQLELLREQLPAALAEKVERELAAEVPATLASMIARVLERGTG